MSKTDQNQTSRIIDILASGSPNHGLKEAVHSALSEKVGIVLDELKNTVAESYFGQSAQAEEHLEEAFESSADDHAHKVAHVTRALKSQGHKPVGEYNIDAGSSGGSHHETRITYNHATDGKKYNKWVRTRARYGKADAAEKDGLAESNLQELSKKTLGSYVKKASRVHGGTMASVAASLGQQETGASVFARRDKQLHTVRKREKGIDRAADKLAKEEVVDEAKKAKTEKSSKKSSSSSSDNFKKYYDGVMSGKIKHKNDDERRVPSADYRNNGGSRSGRIVFDEAAELQELSKKTLGSYIKKASHDVAHKGAITREFSNKANAARKAQDYVGARKASEISDKTFDKSWKRRQGMAKAVDKLTKD